MRSLILASALLAMTACKKDDDKKADAAANGGNGGGASETKTAANVPVSITKPVGVLNVALTSLGSIGSAMSTLGGTSLHLNDDLSFTEADCNEHGEALARSGDPSQDKDDQNRLRVSNARMPLQSFYCQMQKDTGSPDTFLGSVSNVKMVLCILGEGLVFDGEKRTVKRGRADFAACLPGATDAEITEMMNGSTEDLEVSITANRPATMGDPASWDGSVSFDVMGGTMHFLLRDSNDVVALAMNNGPGRPINVDGFLVSINKSTGVVTFESKFQRLRTMDGNSDSGWNRHARAYVQGTFDADMKFTEVTKIEGIRAEMYAPNNAQAGAGLMGGQLWTVRGGGDPGVMSSSYTLDCTYDSNTQTSTCPSPNLLASWKATEGSGACNGALTGQNCTTTALALATDADTQFFMAEDNAAFQGTENWLTSIPTPSYTELTFAITQ